MQTISDSQQQTDSFDLIPDPILLLIFNQLSDVKTLIRCGAVSKRFYSLVPQAENLLVKVDCVISTETGDWFVLDFLRSILQSLQYIISRKRISIQIRKPNSPTEILRKFEKIRRLEIELPAGDLRLNKGTVLRWKAVFGRTLKSCVIFAARSIEKTTEDNDDAGGGDENEIDFYGEGRGGFKLRVVWTISALIAASARHFLLREVIAEHREMEDLVLRDSEGEGTVVMNKEGLREYREGEEEREANVGTVGLKNRTTVPAVRMRMRHEPRLDLPGGIRMKGATLVVVRPTQGAAEEAAGIETEEQKEDEGCAFGAFGGMIGEAAAALLKTRSYLLEMNSF